MTVVWLEQAEIDLHLIKGTRELVITGLPYVVPYYVKGQEVRILAVLHTSRKWPDDFTNLE